MNQKGYLTKLKKDIKNQGIKESITLSIDPDNGSCNVHDGNHRLTCAMELKLEWIPARILKYKHMSHNYRYVPTMPNQWPDYPCPCHFGFTTKNNQ